MNHHKQLLNNNIKDVHSVIHTNTKRHHGNTHEGFFFTVVFLQSFTVKTFLRDLQNSTVFFFFFYKIYWMVNKYKLSLLKETNHSLESFIFYSLQ